MKTNRKGCGCGKPKPKIETPYPKQEPVKTN